jgi:hypothetical protein
MGEVSQTTGSNVKEAKKQKLQSVAQVIRSAGEKWPTSFVSRAQIPNFTGGAIAVGTIANLDSQGNGPAGAFRIGRHVCYPVDSLVEWLIQHVGTLK